MKVFESSLKPVKKLAGLLDGGDDDKSAPAAALTPSELFQYSEARRAHGRNRRKTLAAEKTAVGQKLG